MVIFIYLSNNWNLMQLHLSTFLLSLGKFQYKPCYHRINKNSIYICSYTCTVYIYLHYHSSTNSGVTVNLSDLGVAVLKIEFFDLGVDCLWGKTYQWPSFSFDSFVIVLLMKIISEIHIVDFHNTHSNDTFLFQNRIPGSLHHLTITLFWQGKCQRK